MNKTTTLAPSGGGFIALLQQKAGGVALADLDQALADVVARAIGTHRKGSLTLKITIKPNAKRGVKVIDELKVELPKEEVSESFFFAGDHGELLKNDPAQRELELRTVPDEAGAQPIKAVAAM
jgi:hypothetical protein